MADRRTRSRLGVVALSVAIFIAPFIALLLLPEAGLIVMAVALAAMTMLLHDAAPTFPQPVRRWARVATVVNSGLALACLGLAIWLLARG
jgi:hypothetical protein